ncbi:TPA: AlpA family phage regulatory protein [Klebsiella oxytoca]|jgi:predicted DNA-binding transcriptional regulator AlpA|uniref:helix-turn-helix transcriptional regulator n=1 Tax=Klebsiella oxytoca TaxID=571 RepID=UPI000DFD5E1D|nr:AlpA family phage regulatory protein [Klebsiella oxytoca]MBG2655077.1 AlpA family phage regulatory protein [Klebsiella oxytoca]MBZ7713297.1 AlpA family phage regulatory protein [Klebsiella oxytoca]MDK6511754.1 AlpA family phage regulatory protein [Klebsiella oxytoca]MDK8027920.1 AlpA family phage regulatory protein [Klebsiella oxytoca]STR56249.1 putative regulatory protein [Klebsiella oxytoca]
MTNKTHPISSSPQTTTSLLNDQLVDMAFITSFTGMTDKWFYRLISENAFPAPIKLGRSSRWRKSQVEAWLLERMRLSED